jgi:hypothetical protein
MKDIGWIKMHRSLLNWEWYDDLNVRVLFFHLLLTVNYEDKKWRGLNIKKGSRITGREQLSKETGMSVRNVRTAIEKLESTKELTTKKDPKGSMFTLVNWSKYQYNDQHNDQHIDQAPPSERPASDQRPPTTKEVKQVNKETINKEPVEDLDFKGLMDLYSKQIGESASDIWRESVYRKHKIKQGNLRELVDYFIIHLGTQTGGEYNEPFNKFRTYCSNWIGTEIVAGRLAKFRTVKAVGSI